MFRVPGTLGLIRSGLIALAPLEDPPEVTAKQLEYYDQEGLGQDSEPSDYQQQQLRDIAFLIPDDVRRVLDVGCGSGKLTNHLPDGLTVHGVDISSAALQHVKHPTTVAGLPELPFDDGAFDLVLCTDVLEHIPDSIYQASLAELRRVARRSIMISVPFAERFPAARTLCTSCGRLYHVNDHRRRFELCDCLSLYDDLSPSHICFSGRQRTPREIVAQADPPYKRWAPSPTP